MLRIILSVLFITTIIFSVTAQVQQINPQLELVPIQDVISYFNEHANSPTSSGTLIDSFLSWISEKQQTVSTVNNANLVPPVAVAAPPAAAPIAANVDNNLPVVAAPIVPVTTVHPEQPTQNLPPTVPATEAPTSTSPATTGVATTTATSTMPSASTIRNSTTTMSASRTTTGTTTTTTPPRTNAASILQINNAHNVLTTIALGLIFVSMIYL